MADEAITDPRQERMVDFYGNNIPVARNSDDEILVPLRPLAEALGLSYSSQLQKVRDDAEMTELCRMVRMRVQASGQRQEVFCLPLKLVPP